MNRKRIFSPAGWTLTLCFVLALVACQQAPSPAERVLPSPQATATAPQPTAILQQTGANPGATAVHAGGPATPLRMEMSMAAAPKLNEPVTVVVTLSAIEDAPNTTAHIELGPNAVLVSGEAQFQGNVRAKQPVQFQAEIKFVEPGPATLRGVALSQLSSEQVWGDSVELYLTIGQDASQFGIAPAQQGGSPAPPPANGETPKN